MVGSPSAPANPEFGCHRQIGLSRRLSSILRSPPEFLQNSIPLSSFPRLYGNPVLFGGAGGTPGGEKGADGGVRPHDGGRSGKSQFSSAHAPRYLAGNLSRSNRRLAFKIRAKPKGFLSYCSYALLEASLASAQSAIAYYMSKSRKVEVTGIDVLVKG